MAHNNSPAYAMSVPAGTTDAFPSSGTSFVLAATAAASWVKDTNLILEGMVCQATAAGGIITISDSAVTAAQTFTITTVNPVAGTSIRFGDQGIFMGKGLKVVTAATTGTWLFIYRPA